MRFFDEFTGPQATDRIFSSNAAAYHEMRGMLRESGHSARDARQDSAAAALLVAAGLTAFLIGAPVVAAGLGVGASVFGLTAAGHKLQGARRRKSYDALKKTVEKDKCKPYIRRVDLPSPG